ncbi:MAG: response regulator transcription factor [Pseudomonadota bacterium]
MRVALADDEQELLDQIAAIVVSAGHEVETFRNGTDLQRALQRETYDVVMLDWNMPGQTGLDILHWARENLTSAPPFIMITSRGESEDVVRGLEAGAVDYITKPESDDIIRARLEAAGRRIGADRPETEVKYGKYTLNRQSKEVDFDGAPVAVTAKEFDLIDLLFQNLDRPLSRGYLFSRVWGGNIELETRTIDVHVSRLRSKLELKPENGYVIRTVFGFGYRMDAYIEDETANG